MPWPVIEKAGHDMLISHITNKIKKSKKYKKNSFLPGGSGAMLLVFFIINLCGLSLKKIINPFKLSGKD